MYIDDTIAAIATPPGIGGVGIIRVSGKDSFPIVNSLFLLVLVQLPVAVVALLLVGVQKAQ